jgi:hypothetical protein
MDLAYAFFANAAERMPDGRIMVLGGDFDNIRGNAFPLTFPAFALLVKIRVEPRECGAEHRLRVEGTGPADFRLPLCDLPFTPQIRDGHPERVVWFGISLTVYNSVFPQPGEYVFHFFVDDLELGTASLFVD